MKKYLFIMFFLFVLSISFFMKFSMQESSFLLVSNIEALADDEHTGGMIECHGDGHLYCPANGTSVYDYIAVYQ